MTARSPHAGSVWATGQKHPRHQRDRRYAASSLAHPAKMFPAIAAHAINAYSRPGDTVVDPMCGIGTTLVEALTLGRHAIGVDCEAQWVAVAAGNLHLTRQALDNDAVPGTVIRGDATRLTTLLPEDVVGSVDLIVTSPPYGSGTHGLLDRGAHTGGKVVKTMHRYSNHSRCHRAQLAHRNLAGLTDGLAEVFAACHAVLKPDGIMAVAARPWTQDGYLVDFPSIVTRAAVAAGFETRERCTALLASWNGRHLTAHHSFFRLHNTRAARAKGRPVHMIVHEDILVFG